MRRRWIIYIFLLAALALPACTSRNRSDTPESSPTTSTPPPRASQIDNLWWLISPDGQPFFSLGVCFANQGTSREDFNPKNPSYAAWQTYSDPLAWARSVHDRLNSWGFTTIGAWSDFTTLKQIQDSKLWFTPVLHIGSTAGAPWWDMWDEKIIARMDQIGRDQILPLRDDPRLVGYFTDNEMGWWNATLFKMTLEHAPTSGQRQRLISLLREHYHDDWSQLLQDFDAPQLASWRDLEKGGLLYPRSVARAAPVLRRFLSLVADRYYQLTRDLIRKYDRRALILGDRYQSFYYPEVTRAAVPYVDVISTNLNAAFNDGTFPRFYLDTLHQLTNKPILISEIYMSAKENRSGSPNAHGSFPIVPTQADRAASLRNTYDALLRLPYVVGIDWFQYFDEPPLGRPDGEDYNFGLVDIHDQPYAEITAVTANLNPAALRKQFAAAARNAARPDATQGIPPAPNNPLDPASPTQCLKRWDRQRGFIPPTSDLPLADLYICWTPQALYLGLFALDIPEDAFYRTGRAPESDRMTWNIKLPNRPDPIQIRLGSKQDPTLSDATLRLASHSAVYNLGLLELPASLFNKATLHAGDTIQFSSTVLSHGQTYRTTWSPTLAIAP